MQDRRVPLEVFVGRERELAQVADVLARVAAGQPWLVAIEGDPGMGKTTLARRCLAQVPGLKVLSARGDQAETDLEFGLVDQLLRASGDAFRPTVAAGEAVPIFGSPATPARSPAGADPSPFVPLLTRPALR